MVFGGGRRRKEREERITGFSVHPFPFLLSSFI